LIALGTYDVQVTTGASMDRASASRPLVGDREPQATFAGATAFLEP
jgi:hypothetical protein